MISVVIPVFNASKYIERCINSILSQTVSDWEIIAIDDGSSDDSYKILKKYEEKDARIKVFQQENSGAGIARNCGISKASGDWIVFVDSDDYIEKYYFELLIAHNEDVVYIDVNRKNEEGIVLAEEKLSKYSYLSKDDFIRNQMTGRILWGGVRKAVKASLIKEYDISFTSHRVGEEAIYSFLVLNNSLSFSFIDRAVYNYEVHSNSLSQSFNCDPWGPVATNLKEEIIKLGLYDDYGNTINAFILTAAIISLRNQSKINSYKDYRNIWKKIKIQLRNEIDSNYKVDFKHMSQKARVMNAIRVLNVSWFFYLISRWV